MTALVVDTSVLLKWFHSDGESEVVEARAIRAAHQRGDVEAMVLDLVFYELGNILCRALRQSPSEVAGALDDLSTIVGTPLVCDVEDLAAAAELAAEHNLTFYDASWAAAANRIGAGLVTADSALIGARLGESPADTVRRLDLV